MAISGEMKIIWENVKANHARLNSCEGPHTWTPDPADAFHTSIALKDQKCTKCGGTMASVDSRHYDDGVAHGRKFAESELERLRSELRDATERAEAAEHKATVANEAACVAAQLKLAELKGG